jgi:uncharacterized phage protein (TIGR02218 family)
MTLLDDQKAELKGTTFSCPIWRMVAKDGTVAAYAEAGDGVIVYEGVTYLPATQQSARPTVTTGLDANTSELNNGFDSIVTRANIEQGKWAGAVVYRQVLVSFLNLSLGSVRKQKGKVGEIVPQGEGYKITFESQVSPLSQKLGDLTSNADRNRTLEALIGDVSSFTHSATVTNVTDRRTFKVDYDAVDDTYFENGRVEWLTGNNTGKKLEIKSGVRTDSNTKTQIVLHIKTDSTIQVGDTCHLIRGYKGTRDDAKAIGGDAVLNAQAEWDIQPEQQLVNYPE